MTYTEAQDEIFGVALTVITAADAIKQANIFWPGMPQPDDPPVDDYWARSSYQVVDGAQTSLARLNGQSRYQDTGLLTFQIMAPISVIGSNEDAKLLAQSIVAAYRRPSPTGVITFLNPYMREATATPTHYVISVFVSFQYDNID